MSDPETVHLYTLRSLASSGLELHFFRVQRGREVGLLLRTRRPTHPDEPPHQAWTDLPGFEALVAAIEEGHPARPTLDFTGERIGLHLTTRSRRPGRLTVRSDANPEILNFSTLTPVAEEFRRVLALARAAAPV